MLSHEGLVVNQWAHAQSVGLRSSDRALVTLPLYFGYCNTAQILAHLALGGFLVLAPYSHFAPVAFCRLIEEHGVTVTTVVPAMLEMLVGLRNLRRFDLSSLRMICFGGSGLSEDRQAVVQAALPHVELVQTYGQTEAGPRVTTLRGPDAAGRPGSAGFPIAGVTVDVVDDAGLPLPTGLAGEVRVRSPGTMLGYYRQPEKTAEVLTANGLLTGDLGRLDADGFLYLVGRRRNLILTGGINVYPEEVESYLEESPGVAEALVYGQAHPILGEVPVAEVVPRRPVSAEEILLHARKGLALHKVPRAVRLVKALAKTPSGKKVRPRAREEQS
jgi:long-chain acyl-CoA synthetase